MPRRQSNRSAAGTALSDLDIRSGNVPGLTCQCMLQAETSGGAVATKRTALRFSGMRQLLQNLTTVPALIGPGSAVEHKAISVVTLSVFRGKLTLQLDLAQRQWHTVHFEGLKN